MHTNNYKKMVYLTTIFLLWNISIITAQLSFESSGSELAGTSGINDCAVDMNGDFLDDIVRVNDTHITIAYQNEGGSFEVVNYPMTINNKPSWSICASDLNADGRNDLTIGSGNRASFIISDQDNYEELYIDDYIFCQRSTNHDIDNDGDIDAFICHDVDLSHPYRNDGYGHMVEDQNLIETIPLAGNYSSIWVDYDNDGDSDMFLTKCRQGSFPGDPQRTNALYQNGGNGVFTEVGAQAGVADNEQSWSTSFEDFDNDGDFDMFIVNHTDANRFMLNNGDGTFTDIIEQTNIPANDLGAWENASGDFDNNGFVDIFSQLNNSFYLNNGDLTFTPYDTFFTDGGIGDFNNDGWLDVVNGGNIRYNTTHNGNNWVKIATRGIMSNINGLGARIEIIGDWGKQIREVRSGQSFSPMSSLNVHFGLGSSDSIDQIIVKWPSGEITILENPEINTLHIIDEVSCTIAPNTINAQGNTLLCEGASVALSTDQVFDSYIWSNGETTQSIEVTQGGTYSLIGLDEDNCASFSNSIHVINYQLEIPEIQIDGSLIGCEGLPITLTSSIIDSEQVWSNDQIGNSITVDQEGLYTVSAESQCDDDIASSETVEVFRFPNPAPTSSNNYQSGPTATLVTISVEGENVKWYEQQTGGTPIFEGSIFDAPFEGETVTYYAESNFLYEGITSYGGKPNINGGGGIPTTSGYSLFDVFQPMIIKNVDVLVTGASGPGIRTVQLLDQNGTVLDFKDFDLEVGSHTLEVNFEVTPGQNYSLRLPQNNLFRNNSGVSYPYELGNLGVITTSSFGNGYYYYFYNWEISTIEIECTSERTPVTIELNTSVTGLTQLDQIQIFPNPTSGSAFLRFESNNAQSLQVNIIDGLGRSLGQPIFVETHLGLNEVEIQDNDLPAGVYQIQITDGKESAYHKLIIE